MMNFRIGQGLDQRWVKLKLEFI